MVEMQIIATSPSMAQVGYKPAGNIQNDITLLNDNSLRSRSWPLAQRETVHLGPDGLVSMVDIHCLGISTGYQSTSSSFWCQLLLKTKCHPRRTFGLLPRNTYAYVVYFLIHFIFCEIYYSLLL